MSGTYIFNIYIYVVWVVDPQYRIYDDIYDDIWLPICDPEWIITFAPSCFSYCTSICNSHNSAPDPGWPTDATTPQSKLVWLVCNSSEQLQLARNKVSKLDDFEHYPQCPFFDLKSELRYSSIFGSSQVRNQSDGGRPRQTYSRHTVHQSAVLNSCSNSLHDSRAPPQHGEWHPFRKCRKWSRSRPQWQWPSEGTWNCSTPDFMAKISSWSWRFFDVFRIKNDSGNRVKKWWSLFGGRIPHEKC